MNAGSGKVIPIRLNSSQLVRAEEAAARAGYAHLSTYLRDRALNTFEQTALDDIRESNAELEERVMEVSRKIDMLLFLLLHRASPAEKALLRDQIEEGNTLVDWMGEGK